jgi:type I restriction enzyme S subunit
MSGGTPFKGNDAFWSGSIPWVSAKDMKSFRLHDAEDHISPLALGNGGKLVPAGTILLLVRGMTLHNDVPICMVTREMAFNQDIKALRPAKNVDGAFLAYWLLAHKPDLLASVDHAGHGTGRLVTDTLKGRAVSLPSLAEQKAIAAVLGSLDDKIELNQRMNATLEAIARALFQSWFVDFDPVRAKLYGRKPVGIDAGTAAVFPATFQDSTLGPIPTGWDAVPLYDTAQWVNGAAFRSEDFCAAGTGLPVIKIGELKDGIGAQTKWCQRDAGADKIIDKGDLLYSWSGSPDTSLEAFLWSGGRGLLNQHIFKVISPTAAEKRFVYYLLQYLRPLLVETARNKQTTGLGHVTIADMKRLLVCMPSKAVLTAFDRNIAPIFDKAFTNTLESRTLAALRDTLLPQLLSGEVCASKEES